MTDHPVLADDEALFEALVCLAQADFSNRVPRTYDGSRDDALAYLVNTVSEELERVVNESRSHEVALESAVANFVEVLTAHAAGDFSARAPRTDDGTPLDVLAFVINNTGEETGRLFEERNRAYDELKAAKENEAISRARNAFLANVSHELRTPLTLILGPLTALLTEGSDTLSEHLREELTVTRRNAARLASMVNDLLDFTRAEENKLAVRWQRIDAVTLVRQMVDDMMAVAAARDLSLRTELDDAPDTIVVDRRMFEKIAMNLLSNALKFTMPGGTIVATLRGTDDGVVFAVHDTGIGIAEDDKERIFERFHQVDSTQTRRFEGSGLGLALVREFARAMGGDATVTSEAGRGSTFSVFVPRFRGSPEEVAPGDVQPIDGPHIHDLLMPMVVPGEIAPSASETSTEARPYVLLAEDNIDMRRHIASVLAPSFEVHTVADGQEALDAIAGRLPDVILSDVMMPRIDGFELVSRVKGNPQLAGIPVVLLTARAGSEAAIEGLDIGADDYLAKPFSPAELVARVRSAARLRASNRRVALTLDELQRTKTLLMRAEQVKVAVGTIRIVAPDCEDLPELESLIAAPSIDAECDVGAEFGWVLPMGDACPPTMVPGPTPVVRRALELVVGSLGESLCPASVEELSDGRWVLSAGFADDRPAPNLCGPLSASPTLAELQLGAATLALLQRGLDLACVEHGGTLTLRIEWW